MSKFIVIENMNPEFPTIVTDENGIPKIFASYIEAETEAEDCQDGQIVEI
jgi:hypothetical protein